MTLDEFREIYECNGEICAKLVISEVDCDLYNFAKVFPNLARYFPATGPHWCVVLGRSPELTVNCDWTIFDSTCLTYLMVLSPELSQYCDWSIIDGVGWNRILSSHPAFHVHCDASKLNSSQWQELLTNQPSLQPKFDSFIHDSI